MTDLPLVHLDPGSLRFFDSIPSPDHHALELLRLLPFLQLPGAKPTANEFIQLPEYPVEFLDVIVPHPTPQIRVHVVDDLVHRLAIVAWREPSHLVFEALSGLGTDPNLASENLEAQKLHRTSDSL